VSSDKNSDKAKKESAGKKRDRNKERCNDDKRKKHRSSPGHHSQTLANSPADNPENGLQRRDRAVT
jgi:hypothetical protein